MTEQDKDILIAKMLDSPSSLTDEELAMIRQDAELKDIYEMSSLVCGACMPKPEIDVEREWRLFRHRILPKPSPMRWVMRVAAIFLGVVFLSGIIIKIIDRTLTVEDKPIVAETVKPLVIERPHFVDEVIDDNAASEEKTKMLKANPPRKEVEEVDVDEYLRQQQIEIENEIALINAEIYLNEKDAIQNFMGYVEGNPDMEDHAEAKVIM